MNPQEIEAHAKTYLFRGKPITDLSRDEMLTLLMYFISKPKPTAMGKVQHQIDAKVDEAIEMLSKKFTKDQSW